MRESLHEQQDAAPWRILILRLFVKIILQSRRIFENSQKFARLPEVYGPFDGTSNQV